MLIDPIRHLSVFSPDAFGERRIDIIGCGATGSKVVMGLARLGVRNLHVWDFDVVKGHNIANQLFVPSQIGQPKVLAIKNAIKKATGTKINSHMEKVTGANTLGEIVFLLVDTMESRMDIWKGALKFKLNVKLLIETRMGADNVRIYTLNPSKPGHIRSWEETLCEDKDTEESACGATTSVGATADILSGVAIWQLIRWFAIERGADDRIENEIIFSLRPNVLISRCF